MFCSTCNFTSFLCTVALSVCLSGCLSVCLSACLSLSVSVCLCLSLSVCVCVWEPHSLFCPLSRKLLWIFSSSLPGNFTLEIGRDFRLFFLGLRFPRNEARKLLKKCGETSEQNSGQHSGRNFENKIGELSFCNFSDLTLQSPSTGTGVLTGKSLCQARAIANLTFLHHHQPRDHNQRHLSAISFTWAALGLSRGPACLSHGSPANTPPLIKCDNHLQVPSLCNGMN